MNDTPTETKRCTRCLLPEHTPGIDFDDSGVCSVCRSYQPVTPLGENELLEALTSRNDTAKGDVDCVVPISGGLDSLYAAFYLVKRLGLKCRGVYYNNGMLTASGENVLRWIEEQLGITIVRKSIPPELSKRIVRESLVSLLDFGPRYMQAALCRHCGYGIRAAVYGEMVAHNLHSVWGMHNMDEIPFRYCLNLKPGGYLFQRRWTAALKAYLYRYRQTRLLPPPGENPLRLLADAFGYPKLPNNYSHLQILSFFDYVPWDKLRMIRELNDAGIDTGFLETAHSDCVLSPVVDHVLRRAWGIGKKEVYICNRVRAGQLPMEEALKQIESILGEEPDPSVLSHLGLEPEQVALIFGR